MKPRLKQKPTYLGGKITPQGVSTVVVPAPPPETVSGGILKEAREIVGGVRNTSHGAKERSFVAIARLWNSYLEERVVDGPITAVNVAQMMELMKIARSIQGKCIRDHFVDAAGYAAIAGELSLGE